MRCGIETERESEKHLDEAKSVNMRKQIDRLRGPISNGHGNGTYIQRTWLQLESREQNGPNG